MSENTTNSKSPLSRLLGLLKPCRGKVILAIVLILLHVILFSLAPLFLGQAVNYMGQVLGWKGDMSRVRTVIDAGSTFLLFLGLMVGSYILSSVFSYIATKLLVTATEGVIYDLRKAISEKLSRLPLNYYDTNTFGDVLSRVTNDVDTISKALQQSIYEVLNAVFTAFILLYIMLSLDGILTLVGILSIPIALFVAAKITKSSQKEFDKQMESTGDLNGYVEEYYSGHQVIEVCGREDTVVENFEVKNEELYESSRKAMFLADMLPTVVMNTTNLGYTLVCLAGSIMAILGGMSIGMIQAFTQYLSQFSSSISSVMSVAGIIQSTSAAAKRVFEFLDEEEEIPDAEDAKFPAELKGQVEFDHVKFGYLPHRTLVHDLNVTVNPGEKTAIVGPTGAGKTTLINLIMRFYDVKGGAIRIDGVDIRDMKRERLREIFGMVLQETWLYAGTIMDNIRYGKLDATDEEVIEAAKKARADAFIRTLPGGYQFELLEGASNIAQGQRQLLTIARAMLNNPPIMILDEATSSVDTRTELMIQEAMSEMMTGHTSFVIAHRLSTIRDAQKIMYMQNGDILEIGTHDELMAKGGLYAALYNSQFAENSGT